MSTLRVNTIQNASGGSAIDVPGAAKAWVNFNGTGTVAIRAALNVSSITDNAVGDYTVNFTTAMTDANYGMSFYSTRTAATTGVCAHQNSGDTKTTTACRLRMVEFTNGVSTNAVDTADIAASFLR